jgi:hypothetical protein
MEMMEFSEAAPILHAIAMAEASDESLDLASTAAEFGVSDQSRSSDSRWSGSKTSASRCRG